MLMMRLQRVGRKNDPSFRIVVTDKRTGVKSDRHIDRLGSYNPKMNHVQLDVEKAKEWLAKGVQPSDTMHNILINQKVLTGKKINVLPKKTPIVSEAAAKEAEPAENTEAAEETADAPAAEEAAPETAPEETKEEEPETPTEAAPEEAPADTEEKKDAA